MTDKQTATFRRHLAVLVLEAAVSAVRGEDVQRLNAELAKRWAENVTTTWRTREDR